MTQRPGPRNGRLSATLALLLAATVLGCATTGRRPPKEPVFDRLTVAEFSVIPIVLEDSAARSSDAFRERLADVATGTAQRAALEWQLARVLGDSRGTEAKTPHLSGRVSIPVELPPGYSGWSAVFRKGQLAVAQLELRNHEGVLVAAAEAALGWRQGDWTAGSAKTRRNRPAAESLTLAVELVVERAMEQLVLRELAAAPMEVL